MEESLRDELAEIAAGRSRGGAKCSTCRLPADLLQAIHDGRASGYSYGVLSEFLARKGHKLNDNTIGEHFRRCWK